MSTDPHDSEYNPMQHPEEQPPMASNENPQFGKLLIVLAVAVMLLGLITWASVAYVT